MSTYTLHGITIKDEFQWLEDVESPETREWVARENQRTNNYLAGIPEREQIRHRLTELWNYEKCGVPEKKGGRYFFLRNNGLQNQSVLCTVDRVGDLPRTLVDANLLSVDGTVALTTYVPSPDGQLLAYGLAGAGSDWEEWRVLDIATGSPTADHLRWIKFSTVAWTADGLGFFYCRYDEPGKDETFREANYNQKLYYHRIGTPQSDDVLIFYRPDQKEWVFEAIVSDDGRYLVIHVWNASADHNAVFYRDLELPQSQSPIQELIATFDARYHFIGNDGPSFWLQTDFAAPRGRVISVDLKQPEPQSWREVIPQAEATLENSSIVGEHFVAHYLRDAHSHVVICDLQGRPVRTLELPGIGSVSGFDGRRKDPETFYDFTGFTTPAVVYRLDVRTGETSVFHRPKLQFNPDDYVTRQVFYVSRDGTRIPMFISHRKGLSLDGGNPTELYGYGGFNISLPPMFSPARLAWMESGGIYAAANLRGGGEYGEEWHQAGVKNRKQNVFDDFIAAAEWLVANLFTTPGRLGISGRSNGGLLVGACITQHPELFGAAVAGVGVMDMLRFHKFTIGWSWVSDYGSPDVWEDFQALYAYSPYHNIRPGTNYPPTLITTADHDDRVVPGHSYKFAAALQEAQAGDAPILIRVDVRAGHGMGKPTSKLIDEATDVISFFTRVLRS